jgi:hypothetical protein
MMEFYSAIKKNKILLFAGKWVELENIILSEVSQVQKAKVCMFSLICGTQAQYKYNQYFEKHVMLMEGHIQEREGERKKVRRQIWLMYFLYKNEYKIFKSVEITIRRRLM